jgi:1-acyl-sn-glycerol-3-phosphate acyltransferase
VLRSLSFYLVQAPLAILATAAGCVLACLLGLSSPAGVRAVSLAWSRLLLRLFRVEVKAEGLSNLPAGAGVYTANHSSMLDILVVLAALPLDLKIVHKKSLSYVPLFGWSIALAGHVSIDRSSPFRARRGLDRAAERIRSGESVLLFPEGTRSRDGSVGHFKRGSFSLAIEAGAPVVPVSLVGVKALVPHGLMSLRPGSVTVRVHAPISVAGLTTDSAQRLAEQVRQLVAAGCEE